MKSVRSNRSLLDTKSSRDYTICYMESDFISCHDFKSRYEVYSTIGSGGQASVMEAIDKEMEDSVALKVFKKKNMDFSAVNAAHFEYSMMK